MEDRSARDVVAAGAFVRLCQEVGMSRLLLPSFEYDLTDPEDVTRFYGEVVIAQREAAKTSKRTRRALREKAEQGEPASGGSRGFGTRGRPGGRRRR
jgi:DNA invertase Pin-like site-specific DNA recombinase